MTIKIIMDYGVFRQHDGRARREVIELFHDWECDDPEKEAGKRLAKELEKAQRKYKNVVVYPDGKGFTVPRVFVGSFSVFIESGIFDYE